MDDIVLAQARYEALDRPRNAVRIRLMSTVVRVVNGGDMVEVGVIANSDRSLHRLRARHVVLACFNMLIPYVQGGLPAAQAAALRQNVKMPLVYSNVLVRDWRAWHRLRVHEIYGVSSFHSRVKLDYPVSIGGYTCARDPAEPIVLHLVHVPSVSGIDDPRAALRAARRLLLERRFEDYESAIRTDLSRMLGPGGFDAGRDVLAITVNRWSHGYSWGPNTLVDNWEEHESVIETARRAIGRVTIANSDSGWSAYAHVAIDEAKRAVGELPVD
jgi:spermidine dehydrogenase